MLIRELDMQGTLFETLLECEDFQDMTVDELRESDICSDMLRDACDMLLDWKFTRDALYIIDTYPAYIIRYTGGIILEIARMLAADTSGVIRHGIDKDKILSCTGPVESILLVDTDTLREYFEKNNMETFAKYLRNMISGPDFVVIPFCIYPGEYQPSGHINMERVREFYINYTSEVVDS